MLPVIWMQGFLSGRNAQRMMGGGDSDVANVPVPSAALQQAMDRACAGRSTMALAQVGVELSGGQGK